MDRALDLIRLRLPAAVDVLEKCLLRGGLTAVGLGLDHVRTAFAHLVSDNGVGIGESNLIKVGDGDWSDSIVLETWVKHQLKISKEFSIQFGESIPNTQMALFVLPRIAQQIEARDPALARQMRGVLPRLQNGLNQVWRNDDGWFVRAVLRDDGGTDIMIVRFRPLGEARP